MNLIKSCSNNRIWLQRISVHNHQSEWIVIVVKSSFEISFSQLVDSLTGAWSWSSRAFTLQYESCDHLWQDSVEEAISLNTILVLWPHSTQLSDKWKPFAIYFSCFQVLWFVVLGWGDSYCYNLRDLQFSESRAVSSQAEIFFRFISRF